LSDILEFPFRHNKVTRRTKAGRFVIVVLADIYAVIVLGKFASNPEFDPLENVLLFSLENGCHKLRMQANYGCYDLEWLLIVFSPCYSGS
jgi:hypothetical protein